MKADLGEMRQMGWGFAGSEELKRGGTAPGPPERETASSVVKAPSSSYKYSVQSMGGHGYSTAVSLKPSGYQSKLESKPRSYMRPTESSGHKFIAVRSGIQPYGQDTNSVPWPEVPKSAFQPQEEFKRPRPHLSEAECSDRPVHKPCESGLRPPSRHKPSPKAVGLELPPRPITPPESGFDSFFDRTWSFGPKRPEEEVEEARPDKGTTHIPRDNGRPKSQKKLLGSLEQSSTLLAWDDRAKPRTSCEKAPKSTLEVDKHSKGDIPITVTKTGMPIEGSEFIFIRRRLQTADTGGSKGWTPKITGKNGGSGRLREENHVRSSLESDRFGYAE